MLLATLSAAGCEKQQAPASGPDRSTPRKALISYFATIHAGDLDAIPSFYLEPTTEEERLRPIYGLAHSSYAFVVFNALRARFGTFEGDDPDLMVRRAQAIQDEWQESIKGNVAYMIPPPKDGENPPPIRFEKVGSEWKLSLVQQAIIFPVPPEVLPWAKTMRAAHLDTAADIENGKFATAKEAMDEWDRRVKAALAKMP